MTNERCLTGNQRLALLALQIGQTITSPSLKISMKISKFTTNNWMSIEQIIAKANDWNMTDARSL